MTKRITRSGKSKKRIKIIRANRPDWRKVNGIWIKVKEDKKK